VPQIADVRGLGAMVAVELNQAGSGVPDADFTKRVQQAALAGGLILLSCGVNANVLRFLFPLTISQAVFDEALGILRQALLKPA
jgi:4-aminobutyrate aminotransferase-like enzyme